MVIKKLTMPNIYEEIDIVKEQIVEKIHKQETRYKRVWKIIDTR